MITGRTSPKATAARRQSPTPGNRRRQNCLVMENRGQGVTDHPHCHQQHRPPLLLTAKLWTPIKSQSHNCNVPDGNTADATRVPVPCSAASTAPTTGPAGTVPPPHGVSPGPSSPAGRGEAPESSWQMAIPMATQGCHRQRIKLQREGMGLRGGRLINKHPTGTLKRNGGPRQQFSRPSSPFNSSLA